MNVMNKLSCCGAMLVAVMFLSGCGGARYQINVGNGSARVPVQNVELSADDKKLSTFPVIAPAKVAAAKPRGGDLPEQINVRWEDAEGTPHEGSVEVTERVPRGFRGQFVVEITRDNTLTLTRVESSGEELSTLPWAMPEAWEGSVQLPGME